MIFFIFKKKLHISLDGSGLVGEDNRPNFNAAGMVIQGAAHTYCRKVDALYDEAKEALNSIQSSDRQGQEEDGENPTNNRKGNRRKNDDYSHILDNPYEFTLKLSGDNDVSFK